MLKQEPDFLNKWEMNSIFTTTNNSALQMVNTSIRNLDGIPTLVYYMKPLPSMPEAYEGSVRAGNDKNDILEFLSTGHPVHENMSPNITKLVYGNKLDTPRAIVDYSELKCGSIVQSSSGGVLVVLQHTQVRAEKFVLMYPVGSKFDGVCISEFPLSKAGFWWADRHGRIVTIDCQAYNAELSGPNSSTHFIREMENDFDPYSVSYRGIHLNKIIFSMVI